MTQPTVTLHGLHGMCPILATKALLSKTTNRQKEEREFRMWRCGQGQDATEPKNRATAFARRIPGSCISPFPILVGCVLLEAVAATATIRQTPEHTNSLGPLHASTGSTAVEQKAPLPVSTLCALPVEINIHVPLLAEAAEAVRAANDFLNARLGNTEIDLRRKHAPHITLYLTAWYTLYLLYWCKGTATDSDSRSCEDSSARMSVHASTAAAGTVGRKARVDGKARVQTGLASEKALTCVQQIETAIAEIMTDLEPPFGPCDITLTAPYASGTSLSLSLSLSLSRARALSPM